MATLEEYQQTSVQVAIHCVRALQRCLFVTFPINGVTMRDPQLGEYLRESRRYFDLEKRWRQTDYHGDDIEYWLYWLNDLEATTYRAVYAALSEPPRPRPARRPKPPPPAPAEVPPAVYDHNCRCGRPRSWVDEHGVSWCKRCRRPPAGPIR